MPTGWGGADPIGQTDANDYELGCEYLANADLTITHIRVWAAATDVNVTGRRGRVWSTAGGQLGIATLSDDLPDGWSQYALDTPVTRLAGQRFVVSYSTGGNYGALIDALAAGNVDSGDGNVTALGTGNATNGNGVFNGTPGQFPTTSPAAHPFYGADFVYTLGVGGNTAPRITSAGVTAADAVATATIVAEDDETLVGATYRYDWGDGTPVTATSAATATHTYAASGEYGVLLSVTDADGLADYAAAPITIRIPGPQLLPMPTRGIFAAVESHALASGRFDRVNRHEPKSAPGTGVTASIWVDAIRSVPAASGLALTTARLALNIRVQTSMLAEPADDIDLNVLDAVDALMTAYTGDFTLGGLIRNVDLLGQHGDPLQARAGYLNQDQRLYRVMVVTLPLIVPDLWEQAAS